MQILHRFMLGKVNELLGNADDVDACYKKALQLAMHTPVLPYEELPLIL